MKKSVLAYSYSVIILSCVLFVASFLISPIINSVANKLKMVKNEYIVRLEENIGLSISYDSLSPSVFAGIRMYNIEIRDTEYNKDLLLSIKSINLRWNILKLLSDNPTDALGELVITGFQADYDSLDDNDVIQNILKVFQGENIDITENEKTTEVAIEDENFQTSAELLLTPIFELPIDIYLKNTVLSYSHTSFDVHSFFSKIQVSDQKDTEYLNLLMNGRLTIMGKGNYESFGELTSRLSISGRITNNLESSFAQLRISSLQDSDYAIPRLDIHTSFSNNTVQVVALQNVLPFSIEFVCDFLSSELSVTFNAEDFEPLTLVSYQGENEVLANLRGSTITGEYNFAYNWNSEKMSYDADGHIMLSPLLIGESVNLDYNLFGDEDTFLVNQLDIFSEKISVGYNGSIDINSTIPQGVIDIRSITVPSGSTLSTEIYIDSSENELLVFAPQIYLGEKTLTALHLDAIRNNTSVDFSFEVTDYSRADISSPGVISANGSYDFGDEQFLQLEVLSESLFLASITEMILWYLPQDQAQSLAAVNNAIDPYIFSFNAFFSSDFNSYSYSLPYAIIANTQRDDELLLFSANGNESLFQLPSFNLLAGGQSVQAELSGDLGDGNSEVFFNSSIFVNSIPYAFSGVFLNNEYVTISGDYSSNLTINFLEDNGFYVESSTQSLPIAIDNLLLSLSFDTEVSYTSSTNWIASINEFMLENTSINSALNSRINFTGNINPDGVFLDTISYSDDFSTLEGILASSWNISNAILENATFNLALQDSFSNEKYEVNIEAFNLLAVPFSDASFFENMFFSADATIQDSPSARFASFQNDTNTINAQLTAQGSLENPSANLFVDNASFMLNSQYANFSGSIALEDYAVTVNDVDIILGNYSVENARGSVSLTDFSGTLDGILSGRLSSSSYFVEKTFASPVTLTLTPLSENNTLPLNEKSFNVSVVFEKITSSFLPELENYTVNLLRTPGRYDITAGINDEVVGSLLDSGEISISATKDFFVQFEGFGIFENNELTMVLDNIYADASDYSRLVDLPYFSLHSGFVVGSGTLTGPLNDLQINADLMGSDLEISVPDYVGENLICADFPVTVSQNIFSSQNAYFVAQETQNGVSVDVDFSLEQLTFTYLSLDIQTLNDEYILGRYEMSYGAFEGLAKADLAIYVGSDYVEVRGDITTKDTEAIVTLASVEERLNSTIGTDGFDAVIDLNIIVENQSQMYFPSKNNPLIRGLVNQTQPLLVQIDTRYATSLIAGEFDMRGGEILYLNRTFFVREASAILNESIEDFNPLLTANAEIRERDEDGDPVRILLSVENQHLKQLSPRFESIPSMSEQEIMTLLGQILLGSSEEIDPLVLLGGLADYGTQIAVFRGLEDAVRDFFNLDIFSFRTMFLQNAVVNLLDENASDTLTAGDFLDSTTVYVGTFLDETLYADAMLSLVYDNDRLDLGLRGLVFQPEFGLELPSPFATIRWSIAPDLTTDWNLLVPFTSISFSWKFDL